MARNANPTNTGRYQMGGEIKTAADLAAACRHVADHFKTLYVMGCFGAPMTDTNKARYCTNHPYNQREERKTMIRAADAETFGFDCVNLIKGLLWGWDGDKTARYGGAKYSCNGVPDIGADSMIEECVDISTNFSTIEIGEAVWLKGHIGIYIGDGLAVECSPKWGNGVQITACNRDVPGYNRRNWTKHGKLPYVSYEPAETTDPIFKSPAEKTVEELAHEVIDGKWGNGVDRKHRLIVAGYDYDAVQAEVNRILGEMDAAVAKVVAMEVIAGKWGNGIDRKHRLAAAGHNPDTIQAAVNQILNDVAREVIDGKWGNGANRKARLTAAGYDYDAVQDVVNKILKK